MQTIDILLTSELDGGSAPFVYRDTEVRFNRWRGDGELPLFEGDLWAFVDWLLPEMSGMELCRRLRNDPVTHAAHITMVLDDDDEQTRSLVLKSGADDYIAGPIDRRAVLDRLMSVVHPSYDGASEHVVRSGHLEIDTRAHCARWKGQAIMLRPNELRLLRYFVERPNRVITRKQIMEGVWRTADGIDERTVDVWVGRLRQALRRTEVGNPLRTIRSIGYIFDAN